MPTKRIRNRESRADEGAVKNTNPPVEMPGVSWCSGCRCVPSNNNPHPWSKYRCTQNERTCCYKIAYRNVHFKSTLGMVSGTAVMAKQRIEADLAVRRMIQIRMEQPHIKGKGQRLVPSKYD